MTALDVDLLVERPVVPAEEAQRMIAVGQRRLAELRAELGRLEAGARRAEVPVVAEVAPSDVIDELLALSNELMRRAVDDSHQRAAIVVADAAARAGALVAAARDELAIALRSTMRGAALIPVPASPEAPETAASRPLIRASQAGRPETLPEVHAEDPVLFAAATFQGEWTVSPDRHRRGFRSTATDVLVPILASLSLIAALLAWIG